MVWYSHLSRIFQFVMVHTVKGFGIVNKVDVFLELPCFFDDPTDVVDLISRSSVLELELLEVQSS